MTPITRQRLNLTSTSTVLTARQQHKRSNTWVIVYALPDLRSAAANSKLRGVFGIHIHRRRPRGLPGHGSFESIRIASMFHLIGGCRAVGESLNCKDFFSATAFGFVSRLA
jgi:hypothetical protein